MRIIILGVNGMMGHKLFQVLKDNFNYEVIGTVRNKDYLNYFEEKSRIINIEIKSETQIDRLFKLYKPDMVINCIGVTKKFVKNVQQKIEMIEINSLLPHKLLSVAEKYNIRLIHISTDCVFSGSKGNYSETDNPDPLDIYGKSKVLGEFSCTKNLVIRTSIIGPELNTKRGLLEWFLSQKDECKGFEKAIFSGLTTLELSKVIGKYIVPRKDLTGLINISSNPISKLDLLKLIKKVYLKKIKISISNDLKIDRSLNSKKFYSLSKYICPHWEILIKDMYIDKRVG